VRAQGTKVALASNQHAWRATFMTEKLRYSAAFDHLCYSFELGHAKPTPGYFREVIARIGMPARNLLFLDDSSTNVEAARLAGMNAEVFERPDGAAGARRILTGYGVLHGLRS